MKFGILDYLTEASVEAEILGPNAEVKCFVCRDERQLPDEISELTSVMLWHTIAITAETLGKLGSCRAIIRVGVGYDNVDGICAGELGIPVVNIPDYGTNDVADHTFALLLSLNRKLLSYDAAIRKDPVAGWNPDVVTDVHRLTNATLGIVGLGRIGTAVALRARAFGLAVAFYDPYLPDGYDKALQVQRYDSLNELVLATDFLSLHAPLTEETEFMINSEVLKSCKPGMTLINTARGRIISLDAVYEGLTSGRLRAFAADVLESEPPNPKHPLVRAYTRREPSLDGRILLTPHAGFYAQESRHEMRVKSATQMLRAAQGLPLRNCVNINHLKRPRTSVIGFSPSE
jgi:phosphoglycerate dehydrogenase-like enzyme